MIKIFYSYKFDGSDYFRFSQEYRKHIFVAKYVGSNNDFVYFDFRNKNTGSLKYNRVINHKNLIKKHCYAFYVFPNGINVIPIYNLNTKEFIYDWKILKRGDN